MREAKEIINDLLEYIGIKAPTFAKAINTTYQRVQDIQRGRTKKISLDLANKIISVYPEVNKSYLLKGEGELLNNGGTNISVNHSPNANVAGNDINIQQERERRAVNAVINDDEITKGDLFDMVRHLQHLNDRHLAKIEALTVVIDLMRGTIEELMAKLIGVIPDSEFKELFFKINEKMKNLNR